MFMEALDRGQRCREAHAGLYQTARKLLPLVQALADRERQLEAENTRLRTLLKQAVRPK
jgi:cell shape-determining protein MreC